MEKKKSTQNRHCCVQLCNQRGSVAPNGEKVGFFSFPTAQPARDSWLHAIRRDIGKHFAITPATKVCSLHFKKEDLKKSIGIGRLTYVDGAIPSVFAWKRTSPRKRPPPKARADLSTKPKKILVLSETDEVTEPSTSSELDTVYRDISDQSELHLETTVSEETESVNKSCCDRSCEELQAKLIETQKRLKESEEQRQQLEAKVNKLDEQCVFLNNRLFSSSNFTSDEAVAFYTGFPSHAVFMAIFNYLNPGENAENIRFWRSVNNEVSSDYYEREPDVGSRPGRPRTLSPKEEFFLVLCRLRQGFAERHLAHLFNVSQSTVSRIITTWINYMYLKLGQINIWPSREIIDDQMPQDFKAKYPNTRVIIDCTEIKCQMPSSLLLNSELFSSNKNHTTLKGLIGISPAGHITFVSQLYTGSISDREITTRSGFLDLSFDANDSVMADKGFTIQDILPVGVSLNIPPFLGSSAQMPAADVVKTQEIASLRIHAEKAINKIKNFRIWESVIPLSQIAIVNQM